MPINLEHQSLSFIQYSMVHIPLQELETLYRQIVKDSHSETGISSILIAVSNDVDALCACKMITVCLIPISNVSKSLFQTDSIPHKVVPVSGYADLADMNEKMVQGNPNVSQVSVLNPRKKL